MAIDNFATSLLSKATKSNERTAKNKDRNALVQVGAKLLGRGIQSAAKSIFETKTKAWAEKENILSEKIKYKSAVQNAASFVNRQTAIDETGKGDTSYFYDSMYDNFKKGLKNVTDTTISGDERSFEELVKRKLTPLAEERAKQHREGLALSGTIGTFEQFNTDLERKLKRVNPDNIGDAFVNKAVRLFSGTTKAEQQAEVLDSIRTGTMGKSAKAMNIFNAKYKETKNAVMSYNFATALAGEDLEAIADEEKDILINTKTTQMFDNGNLYDVQETETTNKIAGTSNTTTTTTLNTSFTNPDKVKEDVSKMMTTLNLSKEPRAAFNPDAYANYVQEVLDQKLNVNNVTTVADYATIAGIYSKYATNKANLKDEFQDAAFVASVAAFSKDSLNLDILLASLAAEKPGSPAHTAGLDNVKIIRDTWFMYAGALSESATTRMRQDVTSPNPANIKNIHNISPSMWDGTTAVQRRKINQMTDAARKDAGII
tara:strand:+ start:1069 stop:2529 length:1461 start_codon:yes stop_codon:yes gene_type:complete